MKVVTQKIKVYDYKDLLKPKNSDLKEKVLNEYRNKSYNDTFYYDELRGVYNDVKKFVDKVKSNVNYLQDEISGYRLYTWLINNLDQYWTNINVYSKHVKDNKVTFKSSYFEYKYSHSQGPATKIRTSRIKKVNNLENCFLSGVCYELDLLEDFINFIKRPDKWSTIDDLFNIDSNFDSCCEDIDTWINSKEYIMDHIEVNGYTFDSSGKMINL